MNSERVTKYTTTRRPCPAPRAPPTSKHTPQPLPRAPCPDTLQAPPSNTLTKRSWLSQLYTTSIFRVEALLTPKGIGLYTQATRRPTTPLLLHEVPAEQPGSRDTSFQSPEPTPRPWAKSSKLRFSCSLSYKFHITSMFRGSPRATPQARQLFFPSPMGGGGGDARRTTYGGLVGVSPATAGARPRLRAFTCCTRSAPHPP